MKLKIDGYIETRKSKEGNDYECLVLKLSDNVKKTVFLSSAEIEVLKNNNKSLDFGDMPDLR